MANVQAKVLDKATFNLQEAFQQIDEDRKLAFITNNAAAAVNATKHKSELAGLVNGPEKNAGIILNIHLGGFYEAIGIKPPDENAEPTVKEVTNKVVDDGASPIPDPFKLGKFTG